MPRPGSRTASGRTVRYASADGRHYLASSPVAARSAEPRYAWEIRTTGTDEVVADFEQPLLAGWFVVRGDLVIYDVPPVDEPAAGDRTQVRPPQLRAVRAANGTEVWSHAYRNTRFTAFEPVPATGSGGTSPAR